MNTDQFKVLSDSLATLAVTEQLPVPASLARLLRAAREAGTAIVSDLRPRDVDDVAGGLIILPSTAYTLIIPDLHARRGFFRSALQQVSPLGTTVLEDLLSGQAAVVCVGDCFHAESRARERWLQGYQEYQGHFRHHQAMDQEMLENLRLLEMVAMVKIACPTNFHFLKGNHENVGNEAGEGNYPFGKYAREGEMVKAWLLKFAGVPLFQAIHSYEKTLPLMARGADFLVCHAEPGIAVDPSMVINAYLDPDIIYNLTWVDNDQAQADSVARTLGAFFPNCPQAKIFGGHRPVAGFYATRQDGRYIQINRQDAWLVAIIQQINTFDPERDIVMIGADTLL